MARIYRYVALLLLGSILIGCGGTGATTTATTQPASQVTEAEVAVTQATQLSGTPVPSPEPTTDATEEPTSAPEEAPDATELPEATVASTVEETLTGVPEETGISAQSDDEIRAALQETVDLWSRAYQEAEESVIDQAVDRRAPALRRILRDQVAARTGRDGLIPEWSGEVVDFEQRDFGYVLAHVDVNGRIYTFTFKEVDGKWLLSEPRRQEVGDKQKIETEHVIFEYYPWDEDVAAEIAGMVEDAHNFVVQKLGRGPEEKIVVQLNPTAELAKTSGLTLAFYKVGSTRGQRGSDIVINSPNSFPGGRYDRASGWRDQMTETLNHEYVHLVHDCCFANLYFQTFWMAEGLAVYLTEGGYNNSYTAYVVNALNDDAILPIWAPSPAPGEVPKDLESDVSHDEAENLTAYGLSAALVDYIVTNYGGLDGFWKLSADFAESHDIKKSLQNVFGVSLEEFERAWHEDLKQRYRS